MTIEELKPILKKQIIEYLNLTDMTPDDIADDAILFAQDIGLGLDSIDAIELIVLLEREYGLKINNARDGKDVLIDVNTIAKYIMENSDRV